MAKCSKYRLIGVNKAKYGQQMVYYGQIRVDKSNNQI